MTTKTFIRLMFLLIVATSALLMATASDKPGKMAGSQAEECCAGKEKMDDNNQATGEIMIWDSFSRNLLSSTQ